MVIMHVPTSRVRIVDNSECVFDFDSHDFGNLSTGNTKIGPNSCLGRGACYAAKDGE